MAAMPVDQADAGRPAGARRRQRPAGRGGGVAARVRRVGRLGRRPPCDRRRRRRSPSAAPSSPSTWSSSRWARTSRSPSASASCRSPAATGSSATITAVAVGRSVRDGQRGRLPGRLPVTGRSRSALLRRSAGDGVSGSSSTRMRQVEPPADVIPAEALRDRRPLARRRVGTSVGRRGRAADRRRARRRSSPATAVVAAVDAPLPVPVVAAGARWSCRPDRRWTTGGADQGGSQSRPCCPGSASTARWSTWSTSSGRRCPRLAAGQAEVWLGPAAPADAAERLRTAGLAVAGDDRHRPAARPRWAGRGRRWRCSSTWPRPCSGSRSRSAGSAWSRPWTAGGGRRTSARCAARGCRRGVSGRAALGGLPRASCWPPCAGRAGGGRAVAWWAAGDRLPVFTDTLAAARPAPLAGARRACWCRGRCRRRRLVAAAAGRPGSLQPGRAVGNRRRGSRGWTGRDLPAGGAHLPGRGGRRGGAGRRRPDHRAGRDAGAGRAVRLGQVDADRAAVRADAPVGRPGERSAPTTSASSPTPRSPGCGAPRSAWCCRAPPATCCRTRPCPATSGWPRPARPAPAGSGSTTRNASSTWSAWAGRAGPRSPTSRPGARQRAALAVGIAAGPGLLLVDEPTSQLDTAGRDEVVAALETVNAERGTTIVVVTHDARGR